MLGASPWSAVAGVVVQNWLSAPTPRLPAPPWPRLNTMNTTLGEKKTCPFLKVKMKELCMSVVHLHRPF